jgi:thiamine biosynthesis lipoprotein
VSCPEAIRRFPCFGSEAAIHVGFCADEPKLVARRRGGRLVLEREPPAQRVAERAAADVHSLLADIEARLTRFQADSELCALNADPRDVVPVSPLMARFVDAAIWAEEYSGGLVDAALLDELEQCGYRASLPASLPTRSRAPCDEARRAARPRQTSPWRAVHCDARTRIVTRPSRTRFDSGGIAKGMAADMAAGMLASHPTFAVDCAGDLSIGGTAGIARPLAVENPFGGGLLTKLEIHTGGVATSGTLRRCWSTDGGEWAHHLLDPATGRPANTGIVQVTALAPTALEAEVRAKAALLAGPRQAEAWLPDGGVVVFEDGRHAVYSQATFNGTSRIEATR